MPTEEKNSVTGSELTQNEPRYESPTITLIGKVDELTLASGCLTSYDCRPCTAWTNPLDGAAHNCT